MSHVYSYIVVSYFVRYALFNGSVSAANSSSLSCSANQQQITRYVVHTMKTIEYLYEARCRSIHFCFYDMCPVSAHLRSPKQIQLSKPTRDHEILYFGRTPKIGIPKPFDPFVGTLHAPELRRAFLTLLVIGQRPVVPFVS